MTEPARSLDKILAEFIAGEARILDLSPNRINGLQTDVSSELSGIRSKNPPLHYKTPEGIPKIVSGLSVYTAPIDSYFHIVRLDGIIFRPQSSSIAPLFAVPRSAEPTKIKLADLADSIKYEHPFMRVKVSDKEFKELRERMFGLLSSKNWKVIKANMYYTPSGSGNPCYIRIERKDKMSYIGAVLPAGGELQASSEKLKAYLEELGNKK